MRTWLAYARLVRAPNAFTAAADIALAGAATGALADRTGVWLLLVGASVCLYSAGMAWNDWFDLEQDLRERPGRPIASGQVSPRAAATLGTLLMLAGVGLAVGADWMREGGWRSTWTALLLVGAVFLYDGPLKRTWLGPVAMGGCRFLNVLLGLSAGDGVPAWGYALAFAIGVYVAGVTWFAKTEARMSQQSSLRNAALVGLYGLILGLAPPALALDAGAPVAASSTFPYLLCAYGIFLSVRVLPAIRDPRPDRVQAAVKRAVLGLVVLDAILATGFVGLGGLAILLLWVPARFLGRWVYST